MNLLTIEIVFICRILLEVVGAFAILFAAYVIIGAYVDGVIDRRRRAGKVDP